MNLINNLRNVPDLFTSFDGEKITNPDKWMMKRRSELLNILQNEEYGVRPNMSDLTITINVTEEKSTYDIMCGKAIRKTVEVECIRRNRSFIFSFNVFIPKNVEYPVPAFLEINNRGVLTCDPKRECINSFFPVENIVERGYACAVFRTHEIAPDYDEGFRIGFHRLYPEYSEAHRPDNMMGTISIWAWAASVAMDYFEMDKLIDEKRVAVVGHSRGGKTALLAGALDQRFKMVVSSCSGCSGDAISRGKTGEQISQILDVFPYWFCKNYKKWANNVENMPFDQHFLTAAIAPRLLYVSAKTNDSWADPKSEWETLVQTDPVYNLLGKVGLPQKEIPFPDQPLLDGNIGFHLKTGEHDMNEYDWERYLDFADKHL